jgi:hypothetical protein
LYNPADGKTTSISWIRNRIKICWLVITGYLQDSENTTEWQKQEKWTLNILLSYPDGWSIPAFLAIFFSFLAGIPDCIQNRTIFTRDPFSGRWQPR